MPRRKEPLMNTPARDIMAELEHYAKDRQFYPVQNALYGHMIRRRDENGGRVYPGLTVGVFNYYFKRLVDEGFVQIDPDTRAVRAVKLMIVERDDYTADFLDIPLVRFSAPLTSK